MRRSEIDVKTGHFVYREITADEVTCSQIAEWRMYIEIFLRQPFNLIQINLI